MGNASLKQSDSAACLMVLVLLVAVTAVVALVPLAGCPQCEDLWRTLYSSGPLPKRISFYCETCTNEKKIPLVRRWMYQLAPKKPD